LPGGASTTQQSLTRLEESLANRLDTSAADLRRTLSAGLTQASASNRAAETAWTEVRSAVEERLAAIEDTLDGLAERLEAVTRDTASAAGERISAVSDRLDELATTTIAQQAAGQEQWAADIRGALGDLAEAVQRSLGSLGESLNDAVRSGREEEQGHVD